MLTKKWDWRLYHASLDRLKMLTSITRMIRAGKAFAFLKNSGIWQYQSRNGNELDGDRSRLSAEYTTMPAEWNPPITTYDVQYLIWGVKRSAINPVEE